MGTHEVGIGDQVIIKHDSRDGSRDWVGEPSGEVVAAADDHGWDAVVGEMSAYCPWVVALDSPQYLKDGTGPFTVFAPRNDASVETTHVKVETMLKPENKAMLVTILT